jgi:hypothetical protein
MFWFRTFALGLLGACCLLLAMRPPISVVASEPGRIVVVSSPTVLHCPEASRSEPPVTVVDVAPGVTAQQLASLIVLAPGERITAIDDREVPPGVTDRAALESVEIHAGHYLDLAIATRGVAGARRVLVLLR